MARKKRRKGKASPGRPRVAIDWQRVDNLFWEGTSDKGIAAELGIHTRTLKRRRAERDTAPKGE